jgi:hypothetical protein
MSITLMQKIIAKNLEQNYSFLVKFVLPLQLSIRTNYNQIEHKNSSTNTSNEDELCINHEPGIAGI